MPSAISPKAPFQTAVLFLVFNRPDTTARVFEAIRKAKPPRLYVAADGPRNNKEGEGEKVQKVREIATAVDWPCEVRTLFRNENLGCKYAPSSAISWFFEHEEEGIILEDDCLPHPDFFPYCESLLPYYRNNESIFAITGNNFQNGNWRGHGSYYFSKYCHIWGWASWRRAWKYFDLNLSFWTEWSKSEDIKEKLPYKSERKFWLNKFEKVSYQESDIWDYQWTASVWYHGGLTATPNVNLVSNIGFGPDSTHTKSSTSPYANLKTYKIGEISHPGTISQNIESDTFTFLYHFEGRRLKFPLCIYTITRKTLGRIRRKLNGLI